MCVVIILIDLGGEGSVWLVYLDARLSAGSSCGRVTWPSHASLALVLCLRHFASAVGKGHGRGHPCRGDDDIRQKQNKKVPIARPKSTR